MRTKPKKVKKNKKGKIPRKRHAGVECSVCKERLFSEYGHDFHYCKCGATFVDGGFNYLRCGWDTKKGATPPRTIYRLVERIPRDDGRFPY